MASRQLTLGDLVYKLGFENEEQFVRELDRLMDRGTRESEKGGREAGRGWSQQFKATFNGAAIGSFLGTALSQAFSSAVAAARRFADASVTEFKIYEQGLIQLKLAGETNLGALEERIAAVAKQSQVFSRTDVSVALGGLVKAGYDVETAFALVEAAVLGASSEVNEATGEFGDLGSTAVQVGNILRALQYDSSQTGRVMDVMARAAQDSNLDVSDLVEILSRVGPTARLAGLEIEDVAAAAAVLSNNGMDASLIGTGLRTVLQSLINPTGDLADDLDELGVSIVDRNGNIRDFNDVLDGLHELTQRGGEGLQTLTKATGSYGSTAASSLGQASETVKQFRTDLENAEGSAQELADTMRDSGAGAAAEMEARLADARVELGDKLMPVMVAFYEDVIPPFVSALEKLIGLWNDWYFLIHGTTPELQRAQEQFESQFGPGEIEVLEHIQELRRQRAELAREREDVLQGVGMGGPGAVDDDDRLFVSEVLDPEIAALDEQIRRRQSYYQSLREQNAAAKGVPGADPDATNDLADANRNLADSNREVNKSLTERPTDPLIDEAGRIQRDLLRLQLGFEQGNLDFAGYVENVQAHLRRLDGLYSQATNPEQSLAILRARKGALDELARLEKENAAELERIRAVNRDREEEEVYPRSATGANVRRRADSRAREEAEALQEAWESEVKPALDKIAEERAAAEEEIYPRTGTGANVRRRVARAEADRQAERDAARAPLLEDGRRALAEARAEASAVTTEAHRLGLSVSTAIKDGTIEGLRELEAQLVERLNELGDDPSAAPLMGLLTRTRTGIIDLTQAEIDNARASREYVRQSLANLNLGTTTTGRYVGVLDRAQGVVVRLTEAQRTLGQASREDVRDALEEQITSITRVLAVTEEGTERYYELVAALEQARAALKALNDELDVGEIAMPSLTDERSVRAAARAAEAEIASIQAQIAAGPDAALLAALEGRLAFLQALLQVLQQAMVDFDEAAADAADAKAIEQQADALAGRIIGIAEGFPRAIVEGIETGDIGAALQNALGNASDFFLDSMLEAILGPIKEQLAAAIAESLAAKAAGDAVSGAAGAAGGLAALGPTGLVLGGIALVASLFLGANRRRQAESERNRSSVQRTVSGAPSITYNLNAHVNVSSQADFKDPTFHARWRAETEALVIGLLQKARTT